MMSWILVQGTPVFNAPTLSAKGLLQFAQGVLVLRKAYRSMLSPPMFDSPRAIRCVSTAAGAVRVIMQLVDSSCSFHYLSA